MYVYLFLISCWCVGTFGKTSDYYDPENADIHFKDFIHKYDKQYAHDEEREARFQIFKKNLERVNHLNFHSKHAVHGLTKFMDLTKEEFLEKHTGLLTISDNNIHVCKDVKQDSDIEDSGAPAEFDWRKKGAVTKVKDQGGCGSCFAFSAVGNVEGQYVIVKKQPLTAFSEQQIVDCDENSAGCQGGLMSYAIESLVPLGGPIKEQDYPYKGVQGKCASDKSKVIPKVVGCVSYNLTSQEKVKQLLHKVGPLSIAIAAEGVMYYKKGIITDEQCTGELDHGVLLVGYGSEKGKDYWIVKNSWGAAFGEDGYFRMERSNNKGGACVMLNPAMTNAVVA